MFEPDENFWGPLDFWAPECHYWRGKYYMVSSFRAPGGYRGCQFLEAETPRGPFLPKKNKPATPENWHCLDGTLYEDVYKRQVQDTQFGAGGGNAACRL